MQKDRSRRRAIRDRKLFGGTCRTLPLPKPDRNSVDNRAKCSNRNTGSCGRHQHQRESALSYLGKCGGACVGSGYLGKGVRCT
jgi:hypothetical protein